MTLVAIALALAVQGNAASPGVQAPPQQQPRAGDPMERVCETIKFTGSRLAQKRICATRAEWADIRLRDRQAIEKVQISPCVIQGTSQTGRAAC